VLQLLSGAFHAWIAPPQPALIRSTWLIKPSNPDERLVHDWHKDADHHCVSCAEGYVRPSIVHVGAYFADMTPEHGPTYVIPRSHRDPKASPYNGSQEEPFLCQKQDMLLWDQRTWHRASKRTIEGLRILALFAYYPLHAVGGAINMSSAQREALNNAKDPNEQLLFGGLFKP